MAKIYTEPEDEKLIAGDTFKLLYEVTREDGGEVDFTLSGIEIKFFLSPFNDTSQTVLTKTLSNHGGIFVDPTTNSNFIVTLDSNDTSELDGLYLYQVEITTPLGVKIRRIQGSLSVASIIH